MFDFDNQHYYNRARSCCTYNGLFNRTDPYAGNTQDPQSLHKYLYCHANPINTIDPSGNTSIGTIITIAFIAILLIVATIAIIYGNRPEFTKTIDIWNGSTKEVEFRFSIKSGSPRDYCLVNFRKGTIKNIATGAYISVRHLGNIVDANFPDWAIDSIDVDPVYWSNAGGRWNYRYVGLNTCAATDEPTTPIGYKRSYEFKMCLFQIKDVPQNGVRVDAKKLMKKAIKTIDWEAKVTHNANGTVTYP